MRRVLASLAAGAVLFGGFVAVSQAAAKAATMSARSMLFKLTLAAETGSTTYDRAKFQHWIDADGDCQNARAEVLIAESKAAVSFTSTSRCSVLKGKWVSWYDGATWAYASDVDIDHMVPLKEAWES